MLPLNVLRRGREADQPESLALRAGPLSVRYEEGGLRYIRLGDREVLRCVYVSVMDHNRGTIIPTLADVRVDQVREHFQISFLADHRERSIIVAWRGAMSGN